jgi:hypothetical protein
MDDPFLLRLRTLAGSGLVTDDFDFDGHFYILEEVKGRKICCRPGNQ